MILTTTSTAFLTLSAGLAFCGWRFLRCYRQTVKSAKGKKIGSLLGYLFIGAALQNAIMGFGLLIFAENSAAMALVLLLCNIELTLVALLGVYAAYYIFSPKASPYPLMTVSGIVGIIAFVAAMVNPPNPFLTPANGIDLNMSFPLALATFYLLLISIGANGYIFSRLYLTVAERKTKRLAGILAILAIAGIINVFIRLVLLSDYSAVGRTQSLDSGIALVGIGFIFALVIAPKIRDWFPKKI